MLMGDYGGRSLHSVGTPPLSEVELPGRRPIDESVPNQYQHLHQCKLKRIRGFLEKTHDNLTLTSVKAIPLIVTSM
jgi:hypothetical protein